MFSKASDPWPVIWHLLQDTKSQMLGKSDLIESDLIQGGHPIPRTTLNKLFPAVKITVLTKAIYRFDTICIKLQMLFLIELEQNILQCVWKYKTLWRAKTVLRKKSRSWQYQPPWLQIITQAIVIKTLVLPQKSKLGLSQLVSSSNKMAKVLEFQL